MNRPDETWPPDAVAEWAPVPAAPRDHGAAEGPLPANWFGSLDAVRTRRVPFDVRRPMHWVAAGFAGLVIGLLVLNLVDQVARIVMHTPSDPALSGGTLALALVVNMALFIGAPVVWVLVMYEGGGAAVRERLFLRSDRPGWDVLVGLGAGVAGLVVSYLAIVIFTMAGWTTDNPVVDELAPDLTWGLVFFIPFAAATSEEIFFRAWLHPRIGIVLANVAFGFVHLSYQTPLQVLVPMLLGFLLSITLVRRRSIVPAMVAHFVFNFVAVLLTKLSYDLGWDDSLGSAFW